MRIAAITFVTLDGVMQAPGGPEEDQDGGFAHGGWQFGFDDEQVGEAIVGWFKQADGFLLGRRTYDIFASYWPLHDSADDPVARPLNALPKYVASRTRDKADWSNSSILHDVVADVTRLKAEPGRELHVWGSSDLLRTLIDNDLVDEYRVITYPLHLGAGKRLFGEGLRAAEMKLLDATVTSSGVIIASYQPLGAPRYGTVGEDA